MAAGLISGLVFIALIFSNGWLMKIRYPKFLALLLTFIVVYFLFSWVDFRGSIGPTSSHGYLSAFVAGVLYVYGFTAAFGTGILLSLPESIPAVPATALAAFGSLLGDLVIFRVIREYFGDEIMQISQTKTFAWLSSNLPVSVRRYGMTVLGLAVIASPLPDELGVSLIASGRMSGRSFAILSFLLNAAGILVLILTGRGLS